MKLVLSCEHGGNEIPVEYKNFFLSDKSVLETHRGFDLGALDVFNHLESLADASFFSTESRLLIELNRSLHHKNLFSEYSKLLSEEEKLPLLKYYKTYRNSVEKTISSTLKKNETVLHISVHSFTPILNKIKRNCDIGLLYDSRKSEEKKFCKDFKTEILNISSDLNVRYNYPYLGKADGFTTYLRKQFPENYIGIEVEINQKFAENNVMEEFIKTILFESIESLIKNK